jgi:DNA-directed RNA polymerase subunit RPC12/RpoP
MMNYQCEDCQAEFDEMDQTNHEYKNGICPCCGHNDIKPVDLLIEKELADLKAMREASRIKG